VPDDERLAAILDAAYACFTRHGVRRTTMDDIAREAGISRAAVYLHVRNKEDAFRRLASRLLDGAVDRARAAAAAEGSLVERLTAALSTKLNLTLALWRDSPAHAAELLGDNARLSADLLSAYDTAMRDLLAKTVGAARHDVDAREFAELLFAFTPRSRSRPVRPRSTGPAAAPRCSAPGRGPQRSHNDQPSRNDQLGGSDQPSLNDHRGVIVTVAVLITGTSSGIGPAGGYYHATKYAVEALTDATPTARHCCPPRRTRWPR
jgi:AcrR family transcriptional regulator